MISANAETSVGSGRANDLTPAPRSEDQAKEQGAPVDLSEKTKLEKLLGMFGSSFDGERANAARAIAAMAEKKRLTIIELIYGADRRALRMSAVASSPPLPMPGTRGNRGRLTRSRRMSDGTRRRISLMPSKSISMSPSGWSRHG
jgi:hypothetical protein